MTFEIARMWADILGGTALPDVSGNYGVQVSIGCMGRTELLKTPKACFGHAIANVDVQSSGEDDHTHELEFY